MQIECSKLACRRVDTHTKSEKPKYITDNPLNTWILYLERSKTTGFATFPENQQVLAAVHYSCTCINNTNVNAFLQYHLVHLCRIVSTKRK